MARFLGGNIGIANITNLDPLTVAFALVNMLEMTTY